MIEQLAALTSAIPFAHRNGQLHRHCSLEHDIRKGIDTATTASAAGGILFGEDGKLCPSSDAQGETRDVFTQHRILLVLVSYHRAPERW